MKRGLFHVHSVFSDGEESLERLVEIFRQSDMSFAAVSDHAEVFDNGRMEQYVRLCESLSDTGFLVIPGLEFALHGGDIHILGYGITRRVRFTSMEQLVDGIHDEGGIAVLAHPPAGSTNMIGPIKTKLDGIEVWNGRYDGVHAPRAGSFQLFRRVRQHNVTTAAYCGVDLHKLSQTRKLLYANVRRTSFHKRHHESHFGLAGLLSTAATSRSPQAGTSLFFRNYPSRSSSLFADLPLDR